MEERNLRKQNISRRYLRYSQYSGRGDFSRNSIGADHKLIPANKLAARIWRARIRLHVLRKFRFHKFRDTRVYWLSIKSLSGRTSRAAYTCRGEKCGTSGCIQWQIAGREENYEFLFYRFPYFIYRSRIALYIEPITRRLSFWKIHASNRTSFDILRNL